MHLQGRAQTFCTGEKKRETRTPSHPDRDPDFSRILPCELENYGKRKQQGNKGKETVVKKKSKSMCTILSKRGRKVWHEILCSVAQDKYQGGVSG